MKLKNNLIAFILFLGSTQTHKPMAPDNDLSLLLNNDGFLHSFIGEENILTEPREPEDWANYNYLLNHDSLETPPLLGPINLVNTIPDAMHNHADISATSEILETLTKSPEGNTFPCDQCGKIIQNRRSYKKHVSAHFPVTITCPFASCGAELSATIATLETHFRVNHREAFQVLKKSMFQFASETYHSAVEAQGGTTHRTAKPIKRQRILSDGNQTTIEHTTPSNTLAPEASSTLTCNTRVDRSDSQAFQLLEPLSDFLDYDDSHLHSLPSDDEFVPSFISEDVIPTESFTSGDWVDYNDLAQNPLATSPQSDPTSYTSIDLYAASHSWDINAAPKTSSHSPTKKLKQDITFSCYDCGITTKYSSKLKRHISSHRPVATVCPFDNCRIELHATIPLLEKHFHKEHKQECQALKRPVFQLASETYNAALEAHQKTSALSNPNQTTIWLSASHIFGPETSSTLTYSPPVSRSDFQVFQPLEPPSGFVDYDDSYVNSLLRDDAFVPAFTSQGAPPPKPFTPDVWVDYNDLMQNPCEISQQSDLLSSANAILDTQRNLTPIDIAPNLSSNSHTKKRKHDLTVSCDYCGRMMECSSELTIHIAAHFPVATICLFDNCRKELKATISSLASHFNRMHKEDCKKLKKSLLHLAHDAYYVALKAQGGLTGRTAQPIRQGRQNPPQAIIQPSNGPNTLAPETSLALPYDAPLDRDKFQTAQPLPLEPLSGFLDYRDSYLSSLPSDNSLSPACISKDAMPTEPFTPDVWVDYNDPMQNPCEISPQSDLLSSTNAILDTQRNLTPINTTPKIFPHSPTKKRKNIFPCDYCDQTLTTNQGLKKHIASHFPVSTVCPFDNCRKELRATISSLANHFKEHKKDCKNLKKSVFHLANDTYYAALKVQGGLTGRTAQPIMRRPQKSSQTAIQPNTLAPETNLALPYNAPPDRDNFQLPQALQLEPLSGFLDYDGSYLSLLPNDDSLLAARTSKDTMATEPTTPEDWGDYESIAYHNLLETTLTPMEATDPLALDVTIASRDKDAASATSPSSSRKRKKAFSCAYCNRVTLDRINPKRHFSAHFPVVVACPFDNCRAKFHTTIESLEAHFRKHHLDDCKKLAKSIFTLACETYDAALESAGGIANRIARPIKRGYKAFQTFSNCNNSQSAIHISEESSLTTTLTMSHIPTNAYALTTAPLQAMPLQFEDISSTDPTLVCQYCHLQQSLATLPVHIATHLPAAIVCPFDNCRATFHTAIEPLETHFRKHHRDDCRNLKKSAFTLAYETYNAALKTQRGIADGTVHPVGFGSEILDFDPAVLQPSDIPHAIIPQNSSLVDFLISADAPRDIHSLGLGRSVSSHITTESAFLSNYGQEKPSTTPALTLSSTLTQTPVPLLPNEGSSTLTCSHCNQEIESQYRLSRHISSHFPTPTACPFDSCLAVHNTIRMLEIHIGKEHKKNCKKLKKTISQIAEEAYNAALENSGGLTNRIAKPKKTTQAVQTFSTLVCEHCHMHQRNKATLQIHIATHFPAYTQCPFPNCAKTCNALATLITHLHTNHNEDCKLLKTPASQLAYQAYRTALEEQGVAGREPPQTK